MEEIANSPQSHCSEFLCGSSPVACSMQKVSYLFWTNPTFLQQQPLKLFSRVRPGLCGFILLQIKLWSLAVHFLMDIILTNALGACDIRSISDSPPYVSFTPLYRHCSVDPGGGVFLGGDCL